MFKNFAATKRIGENHFNRCKLSADDVYAQLIISEFARYKRRDGALQCDAIKRTVGYGSRPSVSILIQ